MDEQTLKYMGSRVDKARLLNTRLDELKRLVKSKDISLQLRVIAANGSDCWHRLPAEIMERVNKTALANVTAHLVEIIAEVEDELAKL